MERRTPSIFRLQRMAKITIRRTITNLPLRGSFTSSTPLPHRILQRLSSMKTPVLTLFFTAALTLATQAAVRLPALISDNMVLQQEVPANVWGWADPGEKVTVTFGDKSATATADAAGKWRVKLPELKSGAVGELTIAGTNTLTIKNVAVGEVWVCSGQSNMEFSVGSVMNATEEVSGADFPLIRHFAVTRSAKSEPQEDVKGKWEVCAPQTVKSFTAVGYFFGRELHRTMKVPVGLIHSSWGGTAAELWTAWPVLQSNEAFKPITAAWEKTVAEYPAAKAKYDEEMLAWTEAEKKAKEAGTTPPAKPKAPKGGDIFGSPSCLYNGMIAPLLPYTVRGFTWYQGEANAGNPNLYAKLFPTMIQSWRTAWNEPEAPFLFVQLANFMQRQDNPTDTNWARLREAQALALELPHTGMAVAIDVGEAKDIHPKDKQTVGKRLALSALATVYYRDFAYSGPMFSGAQAEDNRVRLTFRHSDGMKAANGDKIIGFSIAGEDRKFYWANAEISGDHIIVSSPEVKEPAAVRYAWADNPECNLVNAAGLPAGPFRTDTWPAGLVPVKAAAAPAPAVAPASSPDKPFEASPVKPANPPPAKPLAP
jgi:sialate O-acetylesterase